MTNTQGQPQGQGFFQVVGQTRGQTLPINTKPQVVQGQHRGQPRDIPGERQVGQIPPPLKGGECPWVLSPTSALAYIASQEPS